MAYRIPFNRPTKTDRDLSNIRDVVERDICLATVRSPGTAIACWKKRSAFPRCC